MTGQLTDEQAMMSERLLLRLEVEDFLYAEAALLDAWRLDDWFGLFTHDGTYVVPATDARDGDPRETLTLIDDDHLRLHWRVERLKSRHAHREFPYSRTRRLITNVRITDVRSDEIRVEATVLLYRFRYGRADTFIGRYVHTLVRDSQGFRIRHRRAELDMEALSPNGAVSMIF